MTPPGIKPATFQFVAQYLKHCATTVPKRNQYFPVIEVRNTTTTFNGAFK
jgi:hypothetical protein